MTESCRSSILMHGKDTCGGESTDSTRLGGARCLPKPTPPQVITPLPQTAPTASSPRPRPRLHAAGSARRQPRRRRLQRLVHSSVRGHGELRRPGPHRSVPLLRPEQRGEVLDLRAAAHPRGNPRCACGPPIRCLARCRSSRPRSRARRACCTTSSAGRRRGPSWRSEWACRLPQFLASLSQASVRIVSLDNLADMAVNGNSERLVEMADEDPSIDPGPGRAADHGEDEAPAGGEQPAGARADYRPALLHRVAGR